MKSIKVEGLEELVKKLEGAVSNEIIHKGIARTASFVQGQAKLLAPADTGDLRNSIKVSRVENNSAEVYTNSDHAMFNEYGTGSKGDPEVFHTTKEKWTYKGTDGQFHTTHGMKPRPFMRPAAKAGEEQIGGIFDALIREELD